MINVSNLSFTYPHQKQILDHINLDIGGGTFNIFYGPMGSGKTTLLKSIAGLFPKFSGGTMRGSIKTDGKVSMLFQDATFQFAMKNVQEEFYFTLGNLQVDPTDMDDRINDALDFCGVYDLVHRNFTELSGGEKQKVALAIIVAMDCPVILLDEPLANVDLQSQNQIIKNLKDLNEKRNKTIVISDHNVRKYLKTADHFYLVNNKKVEPKTLTEVKEEFPIGKKENPSYKIMTEDDPTFELFNFSLTNQNKNLIEPENIDFYPGVTYLSGRNGVGKTTLLNALCRMHNYNGKVKLNDHDLKKIPEKQLYDTENLVFQHSDDQFLTITVKEELKLARQHTLTNYWNDDRVSELINNFDLNDLMDNVVFNLSGGQKKKLQFVLMMIRDAEVMLLDEPFNGLDGKASKYVFHLLDNAGKNGKTIIFTSHLKNRLSKNADFKVELANHRLTYKESADEY